MRRLARLFQFRYSLAQLLILTLIVSVICACAVTFRGIWAFRFPERCHDIKLSADGTVVGLALSGNGRFCCVVCDAESGVALRWADFDGEPCSFELSKNLSTWAALFDDGRIESGPVEPAQRCAEKPSPAFAALLKPPAGSPWRQQSDCPEIGLSGNGLVLALSRSDQVAVFDAVTGEQARTLSVPREILGFFTRLGSPGKVISLCLSDDGSRLAAGYFRSDPRVDPEAAIAMWNTGNGCATGPPCFLGPGALWSTAWLGNDAVAAVFYKLTGAPSWGCGPRGVLVLSRDGRQTFKDDFQPLPGPGWTAAAGKRERLNVKSLLAASADGKTIAVFLRDSGWLAVLDAATLELRYPIANPHCNLDFVAISDGGARAAVVPVAPFARDHDPGVSVSVIDMQSGTQHQIRPHRNNVACSVALLIPAGLLLAGCAWLMNRTAVRGQQRPLSWGGKGWSREVAR